jgi:hypothetical protein
MCNCQAASGNARYKVLAQGGFYNSNQHSDSEHDWSFGLAAQCECMH